jgi:hypothetical protein
LFNDKIKNMGNLEGIGAMPFVGNAFLIYSVTKSLGNPYKCGKP